MACPDDMYLESQFLEALVQVRHYRIGGSFHDLLDDIGTVIAQFKANGR
jgi:heat shock protein HslJ